MLLQISADYSSLQAQPSRIVLYFECTFDDMTALLMLLLQLS